MTERQRGIARVVIDRITEIVPGCRLIYKVFGKGGRQSKTRTKVSKQNSLTGALSLC